MVWLINTATFRPREFAWTTPPYATFSHVTNEDEASLEDFAQIQRDPCKYNIKIIERACDQARHDGFEWLWNHAACVDKRSSAAQSEAINSLSQIYRDCDYSLIYLEDLDCRPAGDETIGEKLAGCRWTKNVWAIPQLIFPREVCFLSSGWNPVGTKRSLIRDLSSAIGIDEPVLEHPDCLEDYSIARRMSWASQMTAPRTEDFAYALVGLFNVSMPVTYGEGRKAFLKLQEEIAKDTDDFSFVAWDSFDLQEYHGLFAYSPACFRRFRHGPATPLRLKGEVQIHCAGITIQTSLLRTGNGLYLPLEGLDGSMCYIPLSPWNRLFLRRGSQVKWNMSGQMTLHTTRICVKRDLSAHRSRSIGACGGVVLNRSFHPLNESDTAGASRSSRVEYTSNDGTETVAPSVDDFGMTSEYAPSESSSEATSQDDRIAWSAHDRGSVEGTVRLLESDIRPSCVHESISEACAVDNVGEAGCHSPCSSCVDQQVDGGSQNPIHSKQSTPTKAQVLDVAQATKELADIAIGQFLSDCQRQSNKRSFIPWQTQTRKRIKLMESSDQLEAVQTSDSDDGEIVLVKKTKFFACPFYVRNSKYTNCVTRNHLKSIEEVEEHVFWEHRRPMFCPVCKEEFPSGRDRDAHIRLRTCRGNKSNTPEGITDDQEERLNREEKLFLSEDLRWFQIWDTIFPHVERPSSAFYTGEREVSVCAFRQFWIQSGEEIVAAFLEKEKCQSYSIRNEERMLRDIYDLVEDRVADRIFIDSSDTVKS